MKAKLFLRIARNGKKGFKANVTTKPCSTALSNNSKYSFIGLVSQ